MHRCICGYDAENSLDLDEHIITAARSDPELHADR